MQVRPSRLDAAEARRALVRIKIVHTIIWAVFASSIVAVPILIWTEHLRAALALSLLVWVEVVVLLVNRMRCPLTDVAARYTDDRSDSFDIYLPEWLARNNKGIFGTLFVLGQGLLVWRWMAG